MKPRASAPTFPPDEGDARASRPSHADSSHIARRRASSAPAHEVEVGEVELVDEEPARPVRAMRPVTYLPPPPRSLPPPIPLPPPPRPSRPPFQVPIAVRPLPPKRTHLTLTFALVGGGIALAVGSIVGFVFQPRASRVDFASLTTRTTSGSIPAVAPAAPPLPVTTNEIPVVNVATLPVRATTGVVVGAAGHRLWIDGTLAADWEATVACGPHVVQVGSAGTPRTVEVPCGNRVVATP